MVIHLDAHAFQTLAVGIGAGLAVVVRHHDRVHHETTVHEGFAQAEHVHIVGDAEVAAYLVLLDVDGADDDDDFSLVAKL